MTSHNSKNVPVTVHLSKSELEELVHRGIQDSLQQTRKKTETAKSKVQSVPIRQPEKKLSTTDSPTRSFADAVDGKAPDNVRDKDNAAPELKPTYTRFPRKNLAPSGSKGIQRNLKQQALEQKPAPVSILKNHPQPHFLTDGVFIDKPNYSFVLRIENYRTPNGIDHGKISQLEIQHQGKIIAQFTGGQWTHKPTREDDKKMVQELQDKFGDRPKKFHPIIHAVIDRDFDRDL